MRNPGSTRVAAFIGLSAGVLALASVTLIRPPLPLDEMALPDRSSAQIVRDMAKKVMQEIAAFAKPAIDETRKFIDYDIELVRSGARDVPHMFLASLPAELVGIRHTPHRKDRFVALVLPWVLKANEEIAADRARLIKIVDAMRSDARLSAEERVWLASTAERYEVSGENLGELARRIDIIPPSLALAQAAEESGWGTSRFAHEGNALFGQRAVGDQAGLVAAERANDDTVRVRAYESLGAAVHSYAHNLNTHPAYAEFRNARAERRAKTEPLAGEELAEMLTRYSERGTAYVQSLRAIIRLNRLDAFDKARLSGTPIMASS